MSSESSGLSSSITDLAISLMVIFILLLVNFVRVEQGKQTVVRDKVSELHVELDKLKSELNNPAFKDIKIIQDENDPLTLVVIVPESKDRGELFKTSKSEISSYLQSFLDAFGPPFIQLVTKPEWTEAIRSIVIEGHTDRHPFKDREGNVVEYGNLGLSQNRSKEVLQDFLRKAQSLIKEPAIDYKDEFWKLASASGRADRECDILVTAPEEDQSKCRKVQFKIRLKSSMEKKFEDESPQKPAKVEGM